MSPPMLALTPRARMVKMLRGFHRIYRREYQELGDDDLVELYDLLARYMSELHDDCIDRAINRCPQKPAKHAA